MSLPSLLTPLLSSLTPALSVGTALPVALATPATAALPAAPMDFSLLFKTLAPEFILADTALLALIVGLIPALVRRPALQRALAGGVALAGIVVAALWLLLGLGGADSTAAIHIANGMVVLDPLTRLMKTALLAAGFAVVVFAAGSSIREHFAEYLALVTFSLTGMLLLVGTENLLMIFLALEMTSIPLYLLAGFQKKGREGACGAEAALKYFLIGGVSSAVLLFGLSLIYGVTGAVSLRELAQSYFFNGVQSPMQILDPLLLVGIVMAVGGFAFKVAAVPFHLWAPDVYEGAPTPTAAFIASGSKIAAFLILGKFLFLGLGVRNGLHLDGFLRHMQPHCMFSTDGVLPGWGVLVSLLSLASIVVGNLAALRQTNVKRLLAWSAVAQAGYLLLGLTGGVTLVPVLFYALVYGFTTLGAFGVCQLVEMRRGGCRFDQFEGLHKTSPGLAICLAIFMVSLAGIPPLAGFFGKFFLFAGALGSQYDFADMGAALQMLDGPFQPLWPVAIALAFNALSLYYYLIVLKHTFIVSTEKGLPEPEGQPESDGAACSCGVRRCPCRCVATAVIALIAAAVLALGVYPNLLLKPLQNAVAKTTAPATQAASPSAPPAASQPVSQ